VHLLFQQALHHRGLGQHALMAVCMMASSAVTVLLAAHNLSLLQADWMLCSLISTYNNRVHFVPSDCAVSELLHSSFVVDQAMRCCCAQVYSTDRHPNSLGPCPDDPLDAGEEWTPFDFTMSRFLHGTGGHGRGLFLFCHTHMLSQNHLLQTYIRTVFSSKWQLILPCAFSADQQSRQILTIACVRLP
jgi:hypothetical protein